MSTLLFQDRGPYHVETSLLLCSANQWNGFYMIGTSVMMELTYGPTESTSESAVSIYPGNY